MNGGCKSTGGSELLEPVIDDNEFKWLIIKNGYDISDDIPPIRDIAENRKPPKKIHVFKLEKQSLWQCLRCTKIIQSNPSEPHICDKN